MQSYTLSINNNKKKSYIDPFVDKDGRREEAIRHQHVHQENKGRNYIL